MVGTAGLQLGEVAVGILYHTAADFLDAFRREDAVSAFVHLILSSRQNRRTRHTYDEALHTARTSAVLPRWLHDVIGAAFATYCVVRRSAAPNEPRPRVVPHGGMQIPRRVQRILQRHGVMGQTHSDRRNMHQKAMDNLTVLWHSMDGVHCAVWLDNYYRRRFVANPATGYTALSCSVLSVLHIRRIPMCPLPPTINDMLRARVTLAQNIATEARELVAFVKQMVARTIQYDEIRVPLDVPRTGVQSMQWQPLHMLGQTVGRNDRPVDSGE